MEDGTPRGYVPEARIAMERIDHVNEEMKSVLARLDRVEARNEDIQRLAINIERLTVTLQQVVEASHDQEMRIEKMEKADGDKWKEAVKYIGTALLGAVLGLVLKTIGLV